MDTARAILDGHILLSRKQHKWEYTAIDIPMSVSCVMSEITTKFTKKCSEIQKASIIIYENRDLILMGDIHQGKIQN